LEMDRNLPEITVTLRYNFHTDDVWIGRCRSNIETMLRQHPFQSGRCLVFVVTDTDAEKLELDLWDNGWPVCAVHGLRSKQDRSLAMDAFKTGDNPIMITTHLEMEDLPEAALILHYYLDSDNVATAYPMEDTREDFAGDMKTPDVPREDSDYASTIAPNDGPEALTDTESEKDSPSRVTSIVTECARQDQAYLAGRANIENTNEFECASTIPLSECPEGSTGTEIENKASTEETAACGALQDFLDTLDVNITSNQVVVALDSADLQKLKEATVNIHQLDALVEMGVKPLHKNKLFMALMELRHKPQPKKHLKKNRIYRRRVTKTGIVQRQPLHQNFHNPTTPSWQGHPVLFAVPVFIPFDAPHWPLWMC